MADSTPSSKAERILILAPSAADASVCERFLREAQLQPDICADTEALYQALAEPAAALVVAGEALRGGAGASIREHFRQQEAWSSLPLIVLTRRLAQVSVEALGDDDLYGHVRLIERPVNRTLFVNTVKLALRERRQQYRIRDLLDERAEHIAQRDEFLATLGHELRNPLAAIMTCGEVLESLRLDAPQAARCLGVISTQSAQIKRLLDDLSDISRINRRKLSLQCEALSLNTALNEVVVQVQSRLDDSGQRLELEIGDDPMPLWADATRLRQIFANLLVNASRYSPPETTISLSARTTDGLAEVCIRDQGIGMSAETQAHIFEPFFQAPQRAGEPQTSRSGLGVGLTLARSLVALHAGSIQAESEGPGQGSQFRVVLPLQAASPTAAVHEQEQEQEQQELKPELKPEQQQQHQDQDQQQGQQQPQQMRKAPFPSQRILLIEDNLDFGNGLKRLLELRGHDVVLAHDGPSGLSAAESHRPDVVVLDIGLPGLDGYEVATRLRRLKGFDDLRVIAVTGFSRDVDRRRSRRAGIDRHLAKPVAMPELEAAIAGG
ncbi:MAG: hybrid sensor histidine kinase/response regulator [Lamprobacter sp.]|uniref:hybrid sensor histidine kinase/response regulator n=1 Tax=Lamprobacter sp. TaxID=3100796 RepID=UPI002B25B114|nr:hybrid sensor histidine kinase/response regulator [Lamprobacter sp.]MEA3641916.1 hybrid sensor histidine kinase/response regulator [Lamprobacter sp.]